MVVRTNTSLAFVAAQLLAVLVIAMIYRKIQQVLASIKGLVLVQGFKGDDKKITVKKEASFGTIPEYFPRRSSII